MTLKKNTLALATLLSLLFTPLSYATHAEFPDDLEMQQSEVKAPAPQGQDHVGALVKMKKVEGPGENVIETTGQDGTKEYYEIESLEARSGIAVTAPEGRGDHQEVQSSSSLLGRAKDLYQRGKKRFFPELDEAEQEKVKAELRRKYPDLTADDIDYLAKSGRFAKNGTENGLGQNLVSALFKILSDGAKVAYIISNPDTLGQKSDQVRVGIVETHGLLGKADTILLTLHEITGIAPCLKALVDSAIAGEKLRTLNNLINNILMGASATNAATSAVQPHPSSFVKKFILAPTGIVTYSAILKVTYDLMKNLYSVGDLSLTKRRLRDADTLSDDEALKAKLADFGKRAKVLLGNKNTHSISAGFTNGFGMLSLGIGWHILTNRMLAGGGLFDFGSDDAGPSAQNATLVPTAVPTSTYSLTAPGTVSATPTLSTPPLEAPLQYNWLTPAYLMTSGAHAISGAGHELLYNVFTDWKKKEELAATALAAEVVNELRREEKAEMARYSSAALRAMEEGGAAGAGALIRQKGPVHQFVERLLRKELDTPLDSEAMKKVLSRLN